MSRPVKVIASDGNTYYLKKQEVFDPRSRQWVNWNCMFLQEVLVYKIATYLGVSIPECAIIHVEAEHLDAAPSLVFDRYQKSKDHFGSLELQNVEDNLRKGYQLLLAMDKPYVKTSWNNFFKKVVNKDEVPLIIALDLMTANFDRFGNEGNLMIAKDDNTDRKIFVIDHGHAFFGPCWDTNKRSKMLGNRTDEKFVQNFGHDLLRANGKAFSGLGEIFRAMDQHLDLSDPNNHSFMDVVQRIEGIQRSEILAWFIDIPDEWFVDKDVQINEYTEFIMAQKGLVRELLNILARNGAFITHLGGDLNWIEKKTGTQ